MSTRHEEARSEASISAKPISDARCLNSAWEVYELVRSTRKAEEELKMTAMARIIAKHYRELEDAARVAVDSIKHLTPEHWLFIEYCLTGDNAHTEWRSLSDAKAALDALNKALGGKE